MIIESGTTLVANLAAAVSANSVMVSASYADHCRANAQFLPGTQFSQMTNTVRFSLVSMPSSGTQRQIENMAIYNADTSVATVTVYKLASDVSYGVASQGMQPGETFGYNKNRGWYSRNSAGGDEIFTNFISVSTNNVTGTWTSGVSSSIVTASYFSSSRTDMSVEVWTSGVSAKASIVSSSYVSSSRTVMAVECWSSGVSALGSILTSSWVSSNRTVMGAEMWSSGISVGNATAGGTLIPAISSISSKFVAWVVQGSSSSFRILTWPAAQPGDIIVGSVFPDAAVSSLSSGLVLHSHCTKAGQIEVRMSNCSTLVQLQSIKSFVFMRFSPF